MNDRSATVICWDCPLLSGELTQVGRPEMKPDSLTQPLLQKVNKGSKLDPSPCLLQVGASM